MRTKDEIFEELSKGTKEEAGSPEYMGTAIGIYLEVLIDIRDTLQYHLLRIGDLYSAFKEKD